MTPRVRLLDDAAVERILREAFSLLMEPGFKVQAPEVVEMLRAAGARVNEHDGIAHVPEPLARKALASVPRRFSLYSRTGQAAVEYGGDAVQYDPGSSCLNILDAETQRPRPALAADLAHMVQVTEMLPQYAAQSTAMVCCDVPAAIGDLYRLFLVLWYSDKPIVTGAFSAAGVAPMIDLLAADSGGRNVLKAKPRAVFDVCPSPPLNWSEFAAENLVELARAGVPAEIVSMPLAGATAPVTLVGSVVQHAAECLGGIAIHQIAQPGAPIVWGGAPAIFDMRTGTTPMGAIETAMIDMACAQVGQHLGVPTHAYLVASDNRLVDAQAGMESGISAVLGALAGINMISGAGMIDLLACHSIEKLVIDAEAIASAQRLLRGVELRSETLATGIFAKIGLSGDFLKTEETRRMFRSEQHFPSSVIERGASEPDAPAVDTFTRARARVNELVAAYQRPSIAPEIEAAMKSVVTREGAKSGLARLPGIDDSSSESGNLPRGTRTASGC